MAEDNTSRVEAEIEAMSAILGDNFTRRGQASFDAVVDATRSIVLSFLLPEGYPSSAPPTVSTADRTLSQGLQAEIIRCWAGEECAFELFQWAAEQAAASGYAGSIGDAADTTNVELHEHDRVVLLQLDHVRDRGRYEKALLKITASSGVACEVIHSNRGDKIDSKDPFILVRGPHDAVGSFLRQLRSEKVDVDSKGKACLERKASCLVDTTTDKPGALEPGHFGACMENGEGLRGAWLRVCDAMGIEFATLPVCSDHEP